MYCMDLRWHMDKAAHLAYLGTLAQEGFVVASVEYRTSNEGTHPMQLCDIKAAIRYLCAYAKRYRINSEKFGMMGESAGGYLTCMAALDRDKKLDIGEYLEYSSQVQAASPWNPPTDASHFPYDDVEKAAMSSESLLIHGTKDSTVPFSQSLILIFICTGKPVGSFR